MAQTVSRRPLTAESRVRVRVNPCGIFDGQSDTGAGFPPSSSVFPVNINPPSFSILIYHLGDEQYVRQWQQFRDVVSPYRNQSISTILTRRWFILTIFYNFRQSLQANIRALKYYTTVYFHILSKLLLTNEPTIRH
jgi:hypothetical protein